MLMRSTSQPRGTRASGGRAKRVSSGGAPAGGTVSEARVLLNVWNLRAAGTVTIGSSTLDHRRGVVYTALKTSC